MLSNSSILITGGTGSFGSAFVPMTLEKYNPKKIVIYSRDEMKQWEMAKLYKDYPNIRFFIGDVRDKDRLCRALDGIDYVVHAAATKIVPTAEYNPFECIKTNVNGAMNLIDACIDKNVKRIVSLSTDKASSPVNLYGATKLTSDRLFVAGNSYSGSHETSFSVVRYGNVINSRGSVAPFFQNLKKNSAKYIPITHKDMTRFLLSLEQATDLIDWAFDSKHSHGKIAIPKIKALKVTDIANVLIKSYGLDIPLKYIGIRRGEKLHEEMISNEEWMRTEEYENFLITERIIPMQSSK